MGGSEIHSRINCQSDPPDPPSTRMKYAVEMVTMARASVLLPRSSQNKKSSKVMQQATRSCRWMITDNTKETFEAPPDRCHYAVWQLEEAPTTGKRHVQAYVVLTQERTFKTMQKLYPGAHIEKARSSDASCVKYCQKEETRVEGPYVIGTLPERKAVKKSEYSKLLAYTEGSVCAEEVLRRIMRYYLENGICEPPEQRIKTLAVSILQANTYIADPIACVALETARARRIAQGIFERPEDYINRCYAPRKEVSQYKEGCPPSSPRSDSCTTETL